MAWIGSPSELMALSGLGPTSLVLWPQRQTPLPCSRPFALLNESDSDKSKKNLSSLNVTALLSWSGIWEQANIFTTTYIFYFLWFVKNSIICESVKCVPLWKPIKMETSNSQANLQIHSEYKFGESGHSVIVLYRRNNKGLGEKWSEG